MQPHEAVYRGRKQMIVNNFIGGIFWGLGATVGVSIILAILGLILSKINLIPFIGDLFLK